MLYFRPHVRLLERQIEDLKTQLAASDAERRALLDRLLERNNLKPLTVSATPSSLPTMEILSPFPADAPEIQEAARNDWVTEEADYLIANGYNADSAKLEAERAFLRIHKTL